MPARGLVVGVYKGRKEGLLKDLHLLGLPLSAFNIDLADPDFHWDDFSSGFEDEGPFLPPKTMR